MIKAPVIIIGAPRSGTTWLGQILSKSPCFAYSVEPRQIWEYRNWFKPDDVLTRADARPPVIEHIRERFFDIVQSTTGHRLLEKTPNNCFRIDFVDRIFPDAIYVFLARDPRTQIESLREMQAKGPTSRRIWERITEVSTPTDLIPLARRLPWLVERVRGRPARSWGVRPPGWRDLVDRPDYPMLQWAGSMHWALQSLDRIQGERVLRWKYEELSANPRKHIEELESLIYESLMASMDAAEAQKRSIRETNRNEDLPDYTREILRRLGYE